VSFAVNSCTNRVFLYLCNIMRFVKAIVSQRVSILGCWTSHNSTNVERGEHSSASTVVTCRAACLNNSQCTGVDYIPTNPPDIRCWLSGPWSGRRNNGSTFGVTHYDINRDCLGSNFNIRNNLIFNLCLYYYSSLDSMQRITFKNKKLAYGCLVTCVG